MIAVSIAVVLLVLFSTCSLRVTHSLRGRSCANQVGVTENRPAKGASKAAPTVRARRRATKKARQTNRKPKENPRKRRRRRGTGTKRKHGRPRGR